MADDLVRIRAALTDSYVIDREVGRGGMATVYLAEDLKHHRTVAIKVLHPDIAASLGRERFLREIEIVANLRHAGILPLYDSGEADGLLYYVMPYVEGPTLRDRLDREKQLPVEEALRITSELAAALDEAHEHGVVHRDIKPENVLFEGDQPLIADFGVATALEEAGGEKLTRTGVAVGTPSYMSPEQAAGGQADARSDEYGLACVLYEMLGGTPPFTGPTPQAVMARHALDPVPDLGTVRSTVPDGVIAAVERAMAKVPADRYPSAGAFAGALEKGEERRVPRAPKRRRWEYVVGAFIVLAAAALYLVAGQTDQRTNAEGRRLAVLPFDIASAELPDTAHAETLFSDVIDRLSDSGVRPISAIAMRHYRGGEQSLADVTEDLSPDIFWLTRVETRGDSAWVQAELVDAESMTSLSASTLGAPVELLETLVPALVDWATEQLGLSPTTQSYEPDPEALKAFLKGRAKWWDDVDDRGAEWFEKAVEIDPGFGAPWGYLAMFKVRATHLGDLDPCAANDRWLPEAMHAADRALEYDSTLVEPHVARGHALFEHVLDWEEAEREFRAALAKDPDHPDANMMYGYYLMLAGRPHESIGHLDRAAKGHPLDRLYQIFTPVAYRILGRDADGESDLRLLVNKHGDDSWAGRMLYTNLLAQGRVGDAIDFAVRAGIDTVFSRDAFFFTYYNSILLAVGRGDSARVNRVIDEARSGNLLTAARYAYVAGRDELVLPFLEEWWQQEEQRCNRMKAWLLADFPLLADDPRLHALMDEVNIPWRESEVWAEISD